MGNKRPNNRGVSVIELLVVITVLLILASLMVPVAGRMRSRSKVAQCAGNQRQIGVALHLYAADHAGNFPPFIQNSPDGKVVMSSLGDQNTLAAQLVPPKSSYLPDKEVFLDPGGLGRVFTRNANGWADWKFRSANRSGYWHVYISPHSDINPARAEESEFSPNDTVRCAPYKVLMHCYYATDLEKCSHAEGEVNVLRIDGSVQLFPRGQYQPGKDVKSNFGHKRS